MGRFSGGRARAAAAVVLVATAGTACGAQHPAPAGGIPPSLLAQARPIGRGPRFHPPVGGAAAIVGPCRPSLGRRYGAHVEVFAKNRVVLLATGIGVRAPHVDETGRVSRARCYGELVTLDPTGLVLVAQGVHPRLADLFRSWGQPLSRRRLASFVASAGTEVSVYVDGRPVPGPPGDVPLARHAEVVLEVGPYVPPHSRYRFPSDT